MIDFRSDTVTRPSAAMRQRMCEAEVGDDVWGDGAAVLGSVQPQPINNQLDGSLDLTDVAAVIKPDNDHFARTRLLSVENTIGGKVLPTHYLHSLRPFADQYGLALHLDGARIFNAIVKSGADEREVVEPFDSFTICLSKGLGAPIGSLLLGSEHGIAKARRARKMLGGGMRQAGIIAAGGLYALENNVQRLAEDHANAELLARGLAGIDELDCDPTQVQTNIVYARCRQGLSQELAGFLKEQGLLIAAGIPMRLVTHLDVDRKDIQSLVEAIKAFYRQSG